MAKQMLVAALAWLGLGAMQAAPSPPAPANEVSLWRLDCGEFVINQYGAFFSDTFQYPPGPKNVVGSCYLIRHADHYMLWDTGLSDALIGHPISNAAQTITLRRSLVDQLAQIGVRPEQIGFIGLSHWHADHTGQARNFPQARLIMGRPDIELLRRTPPVSEDSARLLEPWLSGGRPLDAIDGDRDVFGDGSVVMLAMPGHTPGHHSLLVRLASGPVLLTGDLYHFTEQVENRGVPPFNDNRADTLASMDRFDRIARNLHARVVIQHEPADIARLPAFPEAAR